MYAHVLAHWWARLGSCAPRRIMQGRPRAWARIWRAQGMSLFSLRINARASRVYAERCCFYLRVRVMCARVIMENLTRGRGMKPVASIWRYVPLCVLATAPDNFPILPKYQKSIPVFRHFSEITSRKKYHKNIILSTENSHFQFPPDMV